MNNIYKSGTGWITPDGKLLGCGNYFHIQILKDINLLDKFQADYEEIEEIEKECSELEENGEHPEWHNYEMACDDLGAKITEQLIQDGYIRVGLNTIDKTIHFECKPHVFKEKQKYIKDVVDGFNAEHGYMFSAEYEKPWFLK